MRRNLFRLLSLLLILMLLFACFPAHSVGDEAKKEESAAPQENENASPVIGYVYTPTNYIYRIKASDGKEFVIKPPKIYGNEPNLTCNTALLFESTSNQLIFAKDPDKRIFPASTTKLMTALLAVENCRLDEIVTVTKSALSQVPKSSSLAGLKADEKMTMENMLKCLLVPSGNDAANVIAEHVSGSVDAFVELMNKRSAELGCKDTNYRNPSGFHDEDHYTTALDLLVVTLEACKYPAITEICAAAQVSVPANDVVKEERYFNNTNFLISRHKVSDYIYNHATGLKTGSTTPAGQCLVATAEKGDMKLISIVMGAQNDTSGKQIKLTHFSESRKLLEWGFNNFVRKELVSTSQVLAEVKVELAMDKDYVVLHPTKSVSELMHRYEKPDTADVKLKLEESITAPVEKGTVLGTATITYNNKEYGTVDLVAMNDVQLSEVLYYINEAEEAIKQDWVKVTFKYAIIVLAVFIVYMIIYNIYRKKKAEKARRKRRYR
ncbi:MAG: D-alanyl-D-alanine carboxypeptidase [Clostridiales bacterium]|nr:D-alanyl-D-alanine carboxypeptidase [Clostridiales bacterium]